MFLETLKQIFDTFGAPVFVPIIVFIIALCLKVKVKKAFMSALQAGIGLQGFMLVLNSFTPIISPVIQKMVTTNGVHLSGFDVGWQATAIVAFSTKPGMIFLAVGLLLQVLLFLVKWTDVFQPSDLWNNYSYVIWGSMVYHVTDNMILSLACMILLNLYSLLISELMARRWSKYYKYPSCTIIAMHNIEAVIFGIAMDPLWNALGFHKVKINPETLQKRFGFIGEPATLGLFLGVFIGILGNFNTLNTLAAWGSVALVGITTSAVMAIFPRVAGIFAQAFLPITEAARKSIKKDKNSDREWYLGINDAAGFGEQATLICGIILIPIMFLVAIILPGNQVLPVVDLLALPFMVQGFVAITNGNILKIIVNSTIWYGLGLYMCTYTAPIFTDITKSVGLALPAGALLITSFNILGKPLIGLVFMAFLSQSPIFIGLAVLVYFALWFLFKKNKTAIYDYLDDQAEKNVNEEEIQKFTA